MQSFFLFLSFLLNQKTSTSKGGRIRGAPQRVERERVASLILMGFLEVPTSSRRCAQRASRINRRRRAGQFALRKPLHVHGGGSSKPGRISRSVITLVGLQRKPTTVPGTHPCWLLLFLSTSLIVELTLYSTLKSIDNI